MCYVEQSNILVITSEQNIKAINLGTGSILWEFTQGLEGRELNPEGVCSDTDGRVYVTDGCNEPIIVLHGETGRFIQTLSEADSVDIWDVYWTSNPPQIALCHGYSTIYTVATISTFSAQEDP